MAVATTLADLRSILSMLLDDSDTSGFYSTAERDDAINNAYFELYNLGVSLGDGMGEEITATTLTVTADTATVALPSDYYKLVTLYNKISETESYRFKAIHPTAQHYWRRSIPQSSKQLVFYIRGSNIVLVPTPNTAMTLQIEYSPEPTEMSSGTDEPVFPKNHRELIAYGALKRLKEKEGIEMTQGSWDTYKNLLSAFERDMEDRQSQESRRLQGDPGYHIYSQRI